MERREFILASGGYALSALGLPDMDSIIRRTKTAYAGAVRVGQGKVAAVRHMVRALGDSASELGGGHARHLAVRYLTQDVAPLPRRALHGGHGQGDLFTATSLIGNHGWPRRRQRANAAPVRDRGLRQPRSPGAAFGAFGPGGPAASAQKPSGRVQFSSSPYA